jgi:hypothetical protein
MSQSAVYWFTDMVYMLCMANASYNMASQIYPLYMASHIIRNMKCNSISSSFALLIWQAVCLLSTAMASHMFGAMLWHFIFAAY